jgi:hypothetical protein
LNDDTSSSKFDHPRVHCRLTLQGSAPGDLRGYDRTVAAFAEEPNHPVEQLLRLGERQGYLTYEMLNERLPDEVVSPDGLDAFLMAMDSRGIRLIDEADVP